jgi:hypothetical protein
MVEPSILDTPMPSQMDTPVGLYFRCILSEKVAVICSPGRQRESSHFSWPFSASPPQARVLAHRAGSASSKQAGVPAIETPAHENTHGKQSIPSRRVRGRSADPVREAVSACVSVPSREWSPIRVFSNTQDFSRIQQRFLCSLTPRLPPSNRPAYCCLEEIKAICLCAKGQAREKASYERRCPRKNPEAQKKHWAAKQEAAK